MRYCKAHNLYIDFRRYREMVKKEGRYRRCSVDKLASHSNKLTHLVLHSLYVFSFLEDIFEEGEIGGHCQLNSEAIRTNGEHKSPLQSWYFTHNPAINWD